MSHTLNFRSTNHLNESAYVRHPNLIAVRPRKHLGCPLEHFEGIFELVSLLKHARVIQNHQRCGYFAFNYVIICIRSIIKLVTTLQQINKKGPTPYIIHQVLFLLFYFRYIVRQCFHISIYTTIYHNSHTTYHQICFV